MTTVAAAELWLCGDLAQYARAALALAGRPDAAPLLRGEHDPAQLDARVRAEDEWLAEATETPADASSAELAAGIAGGSGRDDRLVVAADGVAALPAAVLAAAAGARLVVGASEPEPPDAAELVLVGLVDEMTDELLLGRLRRVSERLAGSAPWAALPHESVVTARDLPALTWLVAKAVLRSPLGGDVALWRPFEDGFELHRRAGKTERGPAADGRELLRLESFELLTVETHGFEACADGGGGTVLCGLHDAEPAPLDAEGVLGCGRGLPCPRGPHPVPLSGLAARTLMLASCNGARFADSILRSDFNLGLAFLDGRGEAYVSSVLCGSGTPLAARAFTAALASGLPLGESVTIANACLQTTGADHPSYVAVGVPWLTAAEAGRHLETFELTDPAAVALARAGRLGVDVAARDGEEAPGWFARIESGERGELVRVFAFRFPKELEPDLEVAVYDRGEAERALLDRVGGVDRWLDRLADAGLDAKAPDACEEVRRAGRALRSLAPQLVLESSAGNGRARLGELEATGRLVAEAAARLLVTALADELLNPFWLTNLLANVQRLEDVGEARCPHCSGPSVARTSVHVLNGERRLTEICPRCGITSDVAFDGALRGLQLVSPTKVERTNGWTAELASAGPIAEKTCAAMRLSADGRPGGPVAPEIAEDELRFELGARPDVPPHRYFMKALVATADEVAFFARPIFLI